MKQRKRKILRPGSRGGTGYYSKKGEWVYGERSFLRRRKRGHVARMHAAIAEQGIDQPYVLGGRKPSLPDLPEHEFPAVYAEPGQHPANVAMVHAALADFPESLQRLIMDQGYLISVEEPPHDQPDLLGQTFLPPSVPRVRIYCKAGHVMDPKDVVYTVRHELGHALIAAWSRTIATEIGSKASDARRAWWRFEKVSRLEHGVTQYALAVELRDHEEQLAYIPHGFFEGDLTGEAAERSWKDEKNVEMGLSWGLSLFGMENFCEIMANVQHAGGIDDVTGDHMGTQRPRTWAAWKEVYEWMESAASKIPNVA